MVAEKTCSSSSVAFSASIRSTCRTSRSALWLTLVTSTTPCAPLAKRSVRCAWSLPRHALVPGDPGARRSSSEIGRDARDLAEHPVAEIDHVRAEIAHDAVGAPGIHPPLVVPVERKAGDERELRPVDRPNAPSSISDFTY